MQLTDQLGKVENPTSCEVRFSMNKESAWPPAKAMMDGHCFVGRITEILQETEDGVKDPSSIRENFCGAGTKHAVS
jgi:hypothetical protein